MLVQTWMCDWFMAVLFGLQSRPAIPPTHTPNNNNTLRRRPTTHTFCWFLSTIPFFFSVMQNGMLLKGMHHCNNCCIHEEWDVTRKTLDWLKIGKGSFHFLRWSSFVNSWSSPSVICPKPRSKNAHDNDYLTNFEISFLLTLYSKHNR